MLVPRFAIIGTKHPSASGQLCCLLARCSVVVLHFGLAGCIVYGATGWTGQLAGQLGIRPQFFHNFILAEHTRIEEVIT